ARGMGVIHSWRRRKLVQREQRKHPRALACRRVWPARAAVAGAAPAPSRRQLGEGPRRRRCGQLVGPSRRLRALDAGRRAIALVAALPPSAAVGYLFAQLHDGPDDTFAVGSRYAEIYSLSVAPARRRHGVGTSLPDALDRRLAELDIVDLSRRCWATRTPNVSISDAASSRPR